MLRYPRKNLSLQHKKSIGLISETTLPRPIKKVVGNGYILEKLAENSFAGALGLAGCY